MADPANAETLYNFGVLQQHCLFQMDRAGAGGGWAGEGMSGVRV